MAQSRTQRLVGAGAAAGLVAPPVLLLGVAGLTVHDWTWLKANGWSAIHRSPVEWPSVLALGDAGWIEAVTFVLCSSLGMLFAASLAAAGATRRARICAGAVAILSLALGLEAFRADASGRSTWHGHVHDLVYPVIPLALLVAAGAILGDHDRPRS